MSCEIIDLERKYNKILEWRKKSNENWNKNNPDKKKENSRIYYLKNKDDPKFKEKLRNYNKLAYQKRKLAKERRNDEN